MGIYTIITDHHQPNYKGVPKASAVMDPHQPNCMFPYKDINGTVVVWYFFWAVANRLNLNFKDHWYEIMAPELTLTTIADVIKLSSHPKVYHITDYSYNSTTKEYTLGIYPKLAITTTGSETALLSAVLFTTRFKDVNSLTQTLNSDNVYEGFTLQLRETIS
jgi:hypothetical protein